MDMTVYVVQEQLRYDPDTGSNVPRFPTIEKALTFGKIQYVLPPNLHPFNQEDVVSGLHKYLSEFNDEDYLILVGNPILLGMATAVASNYNSGKVKFLQWSPKWERYVVVQSQMF
jgi:hypothetical protein